MLQTYNPLDPERILLSGEQGTGKTSAWLDIAEWSVATGSDARFKVIDTDRSVARMFTTRSPEVQAVIDYTVAIEFPEMQDALNAILPTVRPHDVIVCDSMTKVWPAAQDFFVDQIYAHDMAQFFLDYRKNAEAGNPLDGWKDWQYINRLYNGFAIKLFDRAPCHVIVTAQSKPVSDRDSKGLKSTFATIGERPDGQKNLAFQTHTILSMKTVTPGREWSMTTVKDREREMHVDTRLNKDVGFTMAYLVPTAGWSL